MARNKIKQVLRRFNVLIQSSLKKSAKTFSNTGKLANSIQVTSDGQDFKYQVTLEIEDYGKFVDAGRKPGKGVPVRALNKWVKDRKLVLKDKDGKNVRMTEARINSLAYVINRKIKEEGIKPTYFIKDELDKIDKKFADDLAEAMADDLEEVLFGEEDETTEIKV